MNIFTIEHIFFRLTSIYFVIVVAHMTTVGKAVEVGHIKNFIVHHRQSCIDNYAGNLLYYNNYMDSGSNVRKGRTSDK